MSVAGGKWLQNLHEFAGISNVTTTNISFFPATNGERYAFVGLAGGLCVFGTIFNVLMLLAVCPGPGEKSSFACQMCHLLVVQLVMCLVNVPLSLAYIYGRLQQIPLSAYSCRYIQSIYTVCTAVINWADTGLALNRCIALFFPHKYLVWTKTPINIFVIIFTWIPSTIGYMIPPLIHGFVDITILTRSGYCTWWAAGGHDLGKMPLFLGTAIPYFLTAVGATLILGQCYRLTRKRRDIIPASALLNRKPKRRFKCARMLLCMLLWTGACVTPGLVLNNFFPVFVATHGVAIIWLRIVAPLQYSITPAILLACNDEYRSRLSRRYRLVRVAVLNILRRLTRDGDVRDFSGRNSGCVPLGPRKI